MLRAAPFFPTGPARCGYESDGPPATIAMIYLVSRGLYLDTPLGLSRLRVSRRVNARLPRCVAFSWPRLLRRLASYLTVTLDRDRSTTRRGGIFLEAADASHIVKPACRHPIFVSVQIVPLPAQTRSRGRSSSTSTVVPGFPQYLAWARRAVHRPPHGPYVPLTVGFTPP